MKRILFVVLFCIAACRQPPTDAVAQQDEAFRQDRDNIVSELKAMVQRDQDLRMYAVYATANESVIDSIRRAQLAAGINPDSFMMFGSFLTPAQADSCNLVFTIQDSLNTARMVQMINTYGYPSPQSRLNDTTAKVDPFIILHHPHLYFKDTLLTLLAKEAKLKRVDSTTYKMLVWDLNGRQGMPPGAEGITIMQVNKDGGIDTVRQ